MRLFLDFSKLNTPVIFIALIMFSCGKKDSNEKDCSNEMIECSKIILRENINTISLYNEFFKNYKIDSSYTTYDSISINMIKYIHSFCSNNFVKAKLIIIAESNQVENPCLTISDVNLNSDFENFYNGLNEYISKLEKASIKNEHKRNVSVIKDVRTDICFNCNDFKNEKIILIYYKLHSIERTLLNQYLFFR